MGFQCSNSPRFLVFTKSGPSLSKLFQKISSASPVRWRESNHLHVDTGNWESSQSPAVSATTSTFPGVLTALVPGPSTAGEGESASFPSCSVSSILLKQFSYSFLFQKYIDIFYLLTPLLYFTLEGLYLFHSFSTTL